MIDPDEYRRVLGHFASAVTVVTSIDGDEPVGLTCQAFTAVSIEPPLVLLCPSRSSTTWPRIAGVGTFAINILDHTQADIALRFARSGTDKFAGVAWRPGPGGSPLLAGALAWVDATLHAAHDGGDHHIVVGRVEGLGTAADVDASTPLVFYRSSFERLGGGRVEP